MLLPLHPGPRRRFTGGTPPHTPLRGAPLSGGSGGVRRRGCATTAPGLGDQICDGRQVARRGTRRRGAPRSAGLRQGLVRRVGPWLVRSWRGGPRRKRRWRRRRWGSARPARRHDDRRAGQEQRVHRRVGRRPRPAVRTQDEDQAPEPDGHDDGERQDLRARGRSPFDQRDGWRLGCRRRRHEEGKPRAGGRGLPRGRRAGVHLGRIARRRLLPCGRFGLVRPRSRLRGDGVATDGGRRPAAARGGARRRRRGRRRRGCPGGGGPRRGGGRLGRRRIGRWR